MRWKANQMGYSLNQRGLYEGVVRDVQNRTIKTNTGEMIYFNEFDPMLTWALFCTGTVLASETEQDIFRILEVPWQEPHERVRP